MTKLVMTALQPIAERLHRRFARAPWAAAAEMAARLGYVARGFVYVSMGTIALLAVARLVPRTQGALGALEAWGHWPPGEALLWLTGLGLYGFAGWRALQSIFDADHQGHTAAALASRAGQAISGLIYGGLAVSVFGLIDAIHDLRHPDEQAATRQAVATVLDWPLGGVLVLAAGLFIVGAGAGNAIRAVFDNFGRTLKCDPRIAAWAGVLARIGYFGRGVALIPTGIFMLGAGWHARASEARGLGGALQALHHRPYGSVLLAVVAVGLVAFGAFAFVEAWCRPIRPEGGPKTA